MKKLQDQNLIIWHANFEEITSLSFFKNENWKDWIVAGDLNYVEKNYNSEFKNASLVYSSIGIGIMRNNFVTENGAKNVVKKLKQIMCDLNL